MRIVYLIGILLVTNFCIAQNKLIGYVTEQNSGKKPVPNAIINSSGANQNLSTDKGQFILTFQGLEVGENVVLRPEKAGWELVNEKEMKTLIPAKPNENPVKIVLCKAGTLAIAKQAYYKVADPYIIQQYNRKLAALDKEKATYQAEKAKLQEERNRLQNQLEEYAEEFIRVNLDDASEIERRAIALFKEGKIDESIKLRESLKSGIEIKNAVQRKAKEDSVIALHTRNLKALAQDYIFKFDYKSAEQKYEELVLADTTNFDNTFDFAYFLLKQNQHSKAVQYYQSALRLTKTDLEVANIQNALGMLYQDMNNDSEALKAYLTALKKFENLAKLNPEIFELNVALLQNNLGEFYRNKNDYPSAFSAYSKALNIYEQYSKTNIPDFKPGLAMVQNNFGLLYHSKHEYYAALNAFKKSLEIFEELAETNLKKNEPYIATLYNNLGILYEDKNEYAAALSAYAKALEIRENLAKANPDAYNPDFASTLFNLGTLYLKTNEDTLGLEIFSKSEKIYKSLAETNPSTYESFLSTIQNTKGEIYRLKGQFLIALEACLKALEIRERLTKTNSVLYDPDIADTQKRLGRIYQALNNYPAASKAFLISLEIYERLAKAYPDVYEIKFCEIIVFYTSLQISDYQPTKQNNLNIYLEEANKTLIKYPDVPFANSLKVFVNDLQEYFKSKK